MLPNRKEYPELYMRIGLSCKRGLSGERCCCEMRARKQSYLWSEI